MSASEGGDPLSAESKPATQTTKKAQARTLRSLPFEDDRDFELAARGRIAGPKELKIAKLPPYLDEWVTEYISRRPLM